LLGLFQFALYETTLILPAISIASDATFHGRAKQQIPQARPAEDRQVASQHASEPFPEIFETLMSAVSLYGPQRDDRTLLLVRTFGLSKAASNGSPGD
jgi:hypothetical protein